MITVLALITVEQFYFSLSTPLSEIKKKVLYVCHCPILDCELLEENKIVDIDASQDRN